jgi:hypothetical protein
MLLPLFVVISCLTPTSELTSAVSVNISLTNQSPYGNASTVVIDEPATTVSSKMNSTESSMPFTQNPVLNVTTNASENPTTFNPYPAYSMPPNMMPTTPASTEKPIQTSSSSTFITHLPYLALNLFFGLCFFVLC